MIDEADFTCCDCGSHSWFTDHGVGHCTACGMTWVRNDVIDARRGVRKPRKPGTDGDHTFERRKAIDDADDERIADAIDLLEQNEFQVTENGPKALDYFERQRLRREREKGT